MATILYDKDGIAHRIKDARRVASYLKNGFRTTPEDKATFDDVDTNDSGKLSVEEIRSAAKEAGIEGWETKRMKTLKKELGLEE